MNEGLCNVPRRSNRRRERTMTFVAAQNNAFKLAAAAAATAAAAAAAAVTGFSSGLSTIQSIIDNLSIIPVSWNQRQLEQLLKAPLPGNRKHKMGDSNLRTSLSSDAQKECNNTGLYSWPETGIVGTTPSRPYYTPPEGFSPAYYYAQNICYMTFCFFSEKGGIWNSKYPQPPQNPLPAFAATYDRTNASHANSLTDLRQANVLVRLECEHVVPFDEMLFYFGCASNKWWEIYDKVLKEISEHRYKIKIAGSPRNSEWDILKEKGSKEYIKGMQSLVYDYSVALANQLKSDNRIINIRYDGIKLSINRRDDYDGLLDHIFKGTQLPQGMSCPHTGPWLDGVNQICIDNMRGVYDDLFFHVPGGGDVPLRDLQHGHIDSIKGASKILLDERCKKLQELANDGSDGSKNYPIFQKLFVNVIIQAIIELSKIIDLSTLKAEHAEYLRYMQIYRQSMGLPDVLKDFSQKPNIMLTSDKMRADMIAAINNVAPPPAAAPPVSNLHGGVLQRPPRSSRLTEMFKSMETIRKGRWRGQTVDGNLDPVAKTDSTNNGNQSQTMMMEDTHHHHLNMLTDAFKEILSPQRTKYYFPDDSAYSTDDEEALEARLQLDASQLATEFITEHGRSLTFQEELPQLMELFLGEHLFEETLFGLEELLYSPIRGENSEALVDVLEIFFQIDYLRIITPYEGKLVIKIAELERQVDMGIITPYEDSQLMLLRVEAEALGFDAQAQALGFDAQAQAQIATEIAELERQVDNMTNGVGGIGESGIHSSGGRVKNTGRSKTRRKNTRRKNTRRSKTRRNKTRRNKTRRKNTRRSKTRRSKTRRKNTRRSKTRRSKPRRSKTRRKNTRRSKPRRSKTRRSKTRRSKTRRSKTRRSKTRRSKTR